MTRNRIALEVADEFSAWYDVLSESERDHLADLIASRILRPLRDEVWLGDYQRETDSWARERCAVCTVWPCTCPEFADLDDPPEAEGGASHA